MNDGDCPTIFITIDGLRAGALGAYGQTGYETPAFDALAAEAATYDGCYAPAADRVEVLRALSDRLAKFPMVTDDQAWIDSGAYGTLVERPAAMSNASSIDETSTAAVWSAFAERLAEGSSDGGGLWFHATGMHGPWDAPTELWAPLVDDDEDAPVEASVAPPVAEFDDLHGEAACDARFAAACRYAGEVMALDACLAAWLDVFDAVFEGEEARLIVAGLRGYALGEHGRIGPDERLFSETQHVPLFVRDPDPANRFSRNRNPQTLSAALDGLLADPTGGSPARMRSATADVIVTREWLLRLPRGGDPELYVKPDDRLEQNDVASLEEQVTSDLLAELAKPAGVGTAPDKR